MGSGQGRRGERKLKIKNRADSRNGASLFECNDPRNRSSDKNVTALYFRSTGLIFMNQRASCARTLRESEWDAAMRKDDGQVEIKAVEGPFRK